LQPSTLAKRGSILLFLAIIGFYLYGLGHLPLVGPDEPRYTQVAREMFLRHDLISPTLGGHLWFEKPALLYWMMIASFKLFGVSEWSARLPAAVSGLLTIAAVWCIGSRAERSSPGERPRNLGFYSALAAATSLGIVVFSRAASFDIILTMTTTWALAFFMIYELEENTKFGWLLLVGFYFFVGLSLLAKGLVGIVIPISVIGAYYLFRRRLPSPKIFRSLFWGVPLALAVAASWYAPVIWRHGWPFIDQFIIQHHFARYVTSKYHHTKPAYYFLLIFPLLCLPWTAFLIGGLRKADRERWWKNVRSTNGINKSLIFAVAWFVFPVIFFSFSNAKLPGYILPVLPAAALIVGERLSRVSTGSKNSGTWQMRTTAALCFLFAVAAPAYAWRSGTLSVLCSLMIAMPVAVVGIFAMLLMRRQLASVMLIAGATLIALIVALHCAAAKRADYESSKRLLQLADSRGYSQAPVYGMQREDRTPEFYAAGRIVYAPEGEPVMYAEPAQVIDESHRRHEVILTFVPLGEVSRLTDLKSARSEVIGDNGKFAIVAVQAY
jgi:4-amino-4-deoxy-L-arabinose transferase-like glycosyltransferase